MTPDEIADIRTDLFQYTRYMFNGNGQDSFDEHWHQKKICQYLERVVIGDIKRLIINVPPRSGKTYIAVVSFISWAMGNFPDSKFIHTSYAKQLAAKNTYEARGLMQTKAYEKIFPFIKIKKDSTAKAEFRTEDDGLVYAAGSSGTITGYGAGKKSPGFGGAIIIDDPHKPDEAHSKVVREGVLSWYSNTVESRKNSPATPIIVIMQRLHQNDLSGHLLSDKTGQHWDHLVIPAVNNGESFCEKDFPIKEMGRIKKVDPYKYAGQYQQEPAPDGGGILKLEWLNEYETLPDIKYRMIFVDTAQKTGDANDYSVLECWGYTKTGQSYLIDILRGKWESPELLRNCEVFFKKHYAVTGLGMLRAMKVEDKVSGTYVIQTLKLTGIPILGIERHKDKVFRAKNIQSYMESGQVFIPIRHRELANLKSEIALFPRAKNDDILDPFMDALEEGLKSASTSIFETLGKY